MSHIIQHPLVKAHDAKVIVIAPAPICEYKSQEHDREKGMTEIQRLASVTKQYADAATEVAAELNLPCVNLWEIFMEFAGWNGGTPLLGDKVVSRSDKLGELLHDGQ